MTLNNDELSTLVSENYIDYNGESIKVKCLEDKYEYSGRHQEYHSYTFKHPNGKLYTVGYSESTQDSMGWDDCNLEPHELIEVEAVEVMTIEYKAVKQ